MKSTTLKIKGMRCAGCVSSVEKGLRSCAGVSDASVNLLTNSARVQYDEGKSSVSDLVSAVKSTGFEAIAEDETAASQPPLPDDDEPEPITTSVAKTPFQLSEKQALLISLLAIPVVILGMTTESNKSALIQFCLATPIQILLGWPFYRGAMQEVHMRPRSEQIMNHR